MHTGRILLGFADQGVEYPNELGETPNSPNPNTLGKTRQKGASLIPEIIN
jgi:hypothetical protein